MDNNYSESERSYEIDAFKGEILRLMDHNINDIFAEIIRTTSDFSRIRNVMANLNASDSRNTFRVTGTTSEEILKENSVDKKLNYVQYGKLSEARSILESWSVNVEIYNEIQLLREIRNRLSHYDECNKYKNTGEIMKDLFTLDCFLFNFKIKFPDKYDNFKLKYDEIAQKAKDFADKYNEKTTIVLKSNKISIDDYCRELQNDIFYGLSTDAVKEKLYMALGNLAIDISGGKFKKDARIDILKYFYRSKGNEISGIEPLKTEPDRKMGIQCLSSSDISMPRMRTIIRDNNILVDYRCLVSEKARTFLKKELIPVLKLSGDGAKLFYVYESLKGYFDLHGNDGDNDPVIQFIKSNMKMDVYSYIKADEDNAGDGDKILDLLSNKYSDKAFCVITGSQDLIKCIQDIKRDGLSIIDVGGSPYDARKSDEQKAGTYRPSPVKPNLGQQPNLGRKTMPEKESFKPLFKLEKTCIMDSNILLNVSEIPDKGGEVYTLKDHKAIKLVDFVNGGGEGNIYTTSEPGVVAKVYFEKCITKNRKDKLALMTEHQPNIRNVCWPIDIITNKSGEFVGYIMKQARGRDLAKTIFKGKFKDFSEACRELNRTQLVDCLINIFKVISELHRNNILLGDINGGNILIHSMEEIYFVDTDSYQIEQYPCPVGTELFTPPEIFKSQNGELRDFGKFLRSPEDERYALGVLAFMTIIPGATPYPMVEGKFQSGFRFPQTGKKAEGKLTYNCIWSYINIRVKQLFWRIFDDNGRTVTADNWIAALNVYKRDIGDDEIKNKIFITTYKDPKGDTFVSDKTCPLCGMPLNITVEEYNRRAASGKAVWCRACTLKNNHMHNLTTFMTCDDCGRRLCVSKADYDRQIERIIDVTCDRCGRTVSVYSNEYNKRVSRGWSILCSDCDSNMGLNDVLVCCSECDTRNGIRVKYAVPSLADIINAME